MKWVKFGAAVAVVLGLVWAGQTLFSNYQSSWYQRLEAVRDSTRAQVAAADSVVQELDKTKAQLDSVLSLPSVVDTVNVDSIIEVAPPECAELAEVAVALRDENASLRVVADSLSSSYDALRVQYDSLHVAYTSLLDASKPPLEAPKWMPEFGLGATAGYCSTGEACIAVGVTLKWDIF